MFVGLFTESPVQIIRDKIALESCGFDGCIQVQLNLSELLLLLVVGCFTEINSQFGSGYLKRGLVPGGVFRVCLWVR